MRFFCSVAIALLWAVNPFCYSADPEHAEIKAEITKRHGEAVKRLQDGLRRFRSRQKTVDIRRARNTWRSSRAMLDFNRRR